MLCYARLARVAQGSAEAGGCVAPSSWYAAVCARFCFLSGVDGGGGPVVVISNLTEVLRHARVCKQDGELEDSTRIMCVKAES